MRIFREALLKGHSIAVCGPVPEAIRGLLGSLGANVQDRAATPLDALVCAHRSDDELLADTWSTVHAVAAEVFIPAQAGQILLLAPTGRGESARAGLENLARTLSVEWARFGVTTAAIAPGATTGEDDLAALVAFLCSEAGAYYSGCCFELR